MSEVIEEKDKVLSFDLFKVERGREKICKCNPPHYTIDTVNRIVYCNDCGATLDAFDALVTLCEHMKRYEEYQREAIKRTNFLRGEANAELRRRIKNQVFKDMDKEYRSGMLPYCPKCGEVFDPSKIKRWINEKYYIESENSDE